MTTANIIQRYFDGLNQKRGWESLISDEMTFVGPGTQTKGKADYVEATNRFLQVVKSVQMSKTIIDGNDACVVSHYELVSPKGNTASTDVAEIFFVRDEKIESS